MSASDAHARPVWPCLSGVLPMWLPILVADLGAWRLGWTQLGALVAHLAVFTLIFRWWHQAMHHPALGRLNRQHRIHHEQHYPPDRFTSPRYHADHGFAQEAVLLGGLGGLLAASWALGSGPKTLMVAGGICLAMLLLGATLHRAQHVSPHAWERFGWFLHLRALHKRHHVNVRVNYGIVESAYDAALGTLLEPSRAAGHHRQQEAR